MNAESHLLWQELTLSPAQEWSPQSPAWLLVRLAGGQGHWLEPNGVKRSLAAGDGVVTGPQVKGALRASQSGRLNLQCFTVHPSQLDGLLTMAEWHHLETNPPRPPAQVSLFHAGDVVGQKFAQVAALPLTDRGHTRRAMVQVWLEAIAIRQADEQAAESRVPVRQGRGLRRRFQALIEMMTDVDFTKCSAKSVAKQLQCGERHVARLFRSKFGTSLHALQIDFRLRRAQHLLKDPYLRIIDVAYESGHPSLGLFNVMFKRRLGMAPSEWRAQHTRKKRAVSRPMTMA